MTALLEHLPLVPILVPLLTGALQLFLPEQRSIRVACSLGSGMTQAIAAPWREDFALRIARELERTGLAKAPVARGFAEE